MMKRLCSVLFVLVLLAAMTVPALAYMIPEPDNDFVKSHSSECWYDTTYSGYEAQKDVKVYSAPNRQTVIDSISAGSVKRFSWIWKGVFGHEWGLSNSGWVRLSDFRKLYGKNEFYTEHSADIISEEPGELPFVEGREICIYDFPGAKGTLTGVYENDPYLSYWRTYTDENGIKWGEIPHHEIPMWVCITDPYSALPRTAPCYADEVFPAEQAPVGLIVAAVAVIVGVSALTAFLSEKKRAR